MSIQAKEPKRENSINSVQFKCYLELGDMLAISRVVCLFNLTLYASPLYQNTEKNESSSGRAELDYYIKVLNSCGGFLWLGSHTIPRVGHSAYLEDSSCVFIIVSY